MQKELPKKQKKEKGGSQNVKVESKVKADTGDLEKEVSRMRRQMTIQSAALVTAVASNDADKKNKSDTVVFKLDSSNVASVYRDTLISRDTILMGDTIVIRDTIFISTSNPSNIPFSHDTTIIFEPITFKSGSYIVSIADKARLITLAQNAGKNSNWLLEITAINDATGSVSANRKVASARISAVTDILLKNNVKDKQILTQTQLDEAPSENSKINPRRVEIRILNLR